MSLTEIILLGLTLTFFIGVPLYLGIRGRMTRQRFTHSNYSKKRVIKLTILNILMMFVMLFLCLGLYISIISQINTLEVEYIIYSILLVIIIGLTFYGEGIYITSIVLEAYTIPELTKSEFFKTQLLALKLFHHPISHTLVFSGFMFVLLILAILESSISYKGPENLKTLLFAGGLGGIVFSFAQIRSSTAIFNLPASLICFILLLLNFQVRHQTLNHLTIGSYYLMFLAVFNLTTLSYVLTLKRRQKRIFKPLTEIHPLTTN